MQSFISSYNGVVRETRLGKKVVEQYKFDNVKPKPCKEKEVEPEDISKSVWLKSCQYGAKSKTGSNALIADLSTKKIKIKKPASKETTYSYEKLNKEKSRFRAGYKEYPSNYGSELMGADRQLLVGYQQPELIHPTLKAGAGTQVGFFGYKGREYNFANY